MTWKSKLMALFPAIHLLFIIQSIIFFAKYPGWPAFLCILSATYLFPLVCFHLHNLIYPLKEGKENLDKNSYSSWWGGHQIQQLFYALPFLEALLRVIPGLFSLWLRLWGSRVGKKVYWTPNVEIDDRSLLEVGDHCVFGHKIEIISHIVGPRKDGLTLYSKRVKIGKSAFIGAGTRFGPGAVVEDQTFIPVLTDIYIDEVIAKDHQIRYQHPRYPKKES
jgi:hypothetical protein